MKSRKKIKPIHPGEILRTEFLESMVISQYRLAKDIGVTPIRINQIIKGNRAVTADTALRLAHFFGNSEQFWMNLQMHYDLACAKQNLSAKIKKQVQPWPKSGRK